MRGTIVKNANSLTSYGYSFAPYEFDCDTWTWHVGGVQREKETSRYLNRLDVLKELFNVFINRAVGLCSVFGCALQLNFRTCLLRALSIPQCLWSLDS